MVEEDLNDKILFKDVIWVTIQEIPTLPMAMQGSF